MFLDTMKEGYNKYFPYKVVFGETKKHVSGFSIYFDYCNGYTESSKILGTLAHDNHEFEALMGEVRRSNVMRGMNLDDFLVKPV
jgi:RhoGEF domain